ncbi:MAG: hypothetical protein C0487_12420 [Leptothrix sp. (in: Bacteria)]|nr:hypothetical protein [Leptothrix sp. (in: b-proteobacteria)]
MKFMNLASAAIALTAVLASHAAFAQFTVVSRTGQLEARPGNVIDLVQSPGEPGYWASSQSSHDPACSPPRCTENFYHDVEVWSYSEPSRLTVASMVYASASPVDLLNKGEVSLTFDVAEQTDVLLTLGHGISQDASVLAPFSSSYSFGRLLGDGSFESFSLPVLSNGSRETKEQLNLTLQTGRYVMTSRIAFNSSLAFPDGLPPGGFVGERGSIQIAQITQVPEPGTLALSCLGLAVGLMVRARRVARSKSNSASII